jgi:hypothetical protein
MVTMIDVRNGLMRRLSTIPGLLAYNSMPASPKTPGAAVIPRSRAIFSQDGLWRYQFAIWLYVNPSDLIAAQAAFDQYLTGSGPRSIEAAVEADQSLGGIAQYAIVTGWSEYAMLIDVAGGQLLGGRIDVEVVA